MRPELMVRGLDGKPQPPQDVLDRLRRYDARIGLFYTNAAWAITEAWRDDDPRRQWIKEGSVQPEMAFDICGYLPVTCDLDSAASYIERELKSWKPDEYKALRDAVRDWNLGGIDSAEEDQLLGAIDRSLSKDGPSIGVFNVPVQIVDDIYPPPALVLPQPPSIDVVSADPDIAAAMRPRRRKKA